jgi:hypothetical protein
VGSQRSIRRKEVNLNTNTTLNLITEDGYNPSRRKAKEKVLEKVLYVQPRDKRDNRHLWKRQIHWNGQEIRQYLVKRRWEGGQKSNNKEPCVPY